jgi:hypothetical protein
MVLGLLQKNAVRVWAPYPLSGVFWRVFKNHHDIFLNQRGCTFY